MNDFKVGDQVQIVPEWQDPGDEAFDRFVIEAPDGADSVKVRTMIPEMCIQPVAWVRKEWLVLIRSAA